MKGQELFDKLFLKSNKVELGKAQELDKLYNESKSMADATEKAINDAKQAINKAAQMASDSASSALAGSNLGGQIEKASSELGISLPKDVASKIDELDKIYKEFRALKDKLNSVSKSL